MNILNKIDKDITLLLDNLPVGIIRLNNDKQCSYANKWIYETLGVTTLDEVYNKHFSSIFIDDIENEKQITYNFLFDNIETESTYRLYNSVLNEYRWVVNKRIILNNTSITNMINNDNNDNNDNDDHNRLKNNLSDNMIYMFTIQDIHSNKLMELKLRSETQRAEEAYNHKSIFLANMSHEIRTPLNGIIGMMTLLEDTILTNEQQDYIEMLKECSFNLMTIINDILDYSKLEVGKIVLDIRSMNIQECVESTNDIVLAKIYEKSLEYSYNIHPDIPVSIHSDCNRLKQILLNLLSNAIKFTETGSIFLNISQLDETEYNHYMSIYGNTEKSKIQNINNEKDDNSIYLRFDISDDGCGIEQTDQEKLFKSFSQVDNRITNKIYQGTGLGLAISKELVELMDGCIWLDWSEYSKGSRFSFVIKTIIAEEELHSIGDTNDSILKNINVLIVDDNLYNRISLMGMITKWGMKPYAFSNSEEALYYAKIEHFDIGLIDICMPKLDGTGFAIKLREQNEFNNKSFPLIALSSLGDKTIGISKHFKTHLIKPIKENKLKQVCIDILRKYQKINGNLIKIDDTKNNNEKIINNNEGSSSKDQTIDTYLNQNNLTELKDNIRILLAEDIFINQRVIVSFLNKLGYHNLDIVDDGQQCLDLVYKNQYDILFLDIRMPVMSGDIVLKELKKYYKNNIKRIPYMVAVTAYCLREDKDKYLSLGFDDYIPKPITMIELSRCMNTFIQKLLID
jgi:signal transduction histidine kinase/DNA-binding response OmpR family regulator